MWISILSLNFHGMGNREKRVVIKDVVLSNREKRVVIKYVVLRSKAEVILLQETKLSSLDSGIIHEICPFFSSLGPSEASGLSGIQLKSR